MLARVRSNLSLRDLGRAIAGGEAHPAERLECAFAARFGFPHAVLFAYGRSGLQALCEALGPLDGEVLCPAYICAEVPYAVSLTGDRLVFVDSAADHFLPGPSQWRAVATARARIAIIAPLFGYPLDRNSTRVLRRAAPEAFVLYDEAQSYGVADDAGLQAHDADGVLLSLGVGKMATAVSGGVLLLRDGALYRRVRERRDRCCAPASLAHAIKRAIIGAAVWLAFREPALTAVDLIGRWSGLIPSQAEDWLPAAAPKSPSDANNLPSSFQTRLGLNQFARLDSFLASRRRVGEYYQRRLHDEGVRTFAASATPTWPRYPLPVADRTAVMKALRANGIQVSPFLSYSCTELPVYRDCARTFPHAAIWGRSMINLPNWHGLRLESAKRVIDAFLRLRDHNPAATAWPPSVFGH